MSSNEDKQLTGLLAELKNREDGFQTPPPEYFDGLANRAIEMAERPARRLLLPLWSYAAAACCLLLAVGLWWQQPQTTAMADRTAKSPTADELLADLSDQEINEFLETPTTDLETEIYTGFLPQNDGDDF